MIIIFAFCCFFFNCPGLVSCGRVLPGIYFTTPVVADSEVLKLCGIHHRGVISTHQHGKHTHARTAGDVNRVAHNTQHTTHHANTRVRLSQRTPTLYVNIPHTALIRTITRCAAGAAGPVVMPASASPRAAEALYPSGRPRYQQRHLSKIVPVNLVHSHVTRKRPPDESAKHDTTRHNTQYRKHVSNPFISSPAVRFEGQTINTYDTYRV